MKKPTASEFIDRYNRRVLTDDGKPGMNGKEDCGSVWTKYVDSGAGGHGTFWMRLTAGLFKNGKEYDE